MDEISLVCDVPGQKWGGGSRWQPVGGCEKCRQEFLRLAETSAFGLTGQTGYAEMDSLIII